MVPGAANVLWNLSGERAKSVDHGRQAEALAESPGDERRLARALGLLRSEPGSGGIQTARSS